MIEISPRKTGGLRPDGKIAKGLDAIVDKGIDIMGVKILYDDHPWLKGPIGNPAGIGEGYFLQLGQQQGLHVVKNHNEGLLANFAKDLEGVHFNPDLITPEIVNFYEHTSGYTMDLDIKWKKTAKLLFGLSHTLFTRRYGQMNMPLNDPPDGAIQSDIYALEEVGDRVPKMTGWVRRNRQTGETVLSGAYSIAKLPNNPDVQCIRVVFPIPCGNATVFLEPRNLEDGAMRLVSKGDQFGDPGLYIVQNETDVSAQVVYLKKFTQELNFTMDSFDRLQAQHSFAFGKRGILELDYAIACKNGQ